jgi:hypothetical protein
MKLIFITGILFFTINANAQLGELFRKLGDAVDTITAPQKDRRPTNTEENKNIDNPRNEKPVANKNTNNENIKINEEIKDENKIRREEEQAQKQNVPQLQPQTSSGGQGPEKVLLSEAISILNSLSSDLATKDRIKIYENALIKFDKIIEQYGSTDTGLTLKSTGRFGDFDYKKIQQNYTQELTSYYVKTCEVSPSSICQGFVGLKDGIDGCKSSKTFGDLRNAHLNLINSMIIFGEQEKNVGLYKLTKSNYLQCNKKTVDVNEDIARDYFNFQLIKVLLQMKEDGNARGVIENIKNPYYKFASVIELKKSSNEIIDKPYVARMVKFLDDKFPNEKEKRGGEINYLRTASMLSLSNIAFSNNSKYVYGDDFGQPGSLFEKLIIVLAAKETASGRDASINSNRCEDPIFAREVFELSNEYLENFYVKSIKGFDSTFIPPQNARLMQQGFVKANMMTSTKLNGDAFEIPLFNGCAEKYTIALSAIATLYGENKPKEAQKYYLQFTTGNFATDKLKLIDLFLEYNGLNGAYRKTINPSEIPTKIPFIMTGVDGNFAIFKKSVDNDLICEASSLLFNELKDSKYTVTARSYLNSKNKLSKKKVKCGDEDLELLLK